MNSSKLAGLYTSFLEAGCLSKRPLGRVGLDVKPPPQLGHTFSKMSLTQSVQNVHSNVQIIASELSFGRDLLQCSHDGLNSNIVDIKLYIIL